MKYNKININLIQIILEYINIIIKILSNNVLLKLI